MQPESDNMEHIHINYVVMLWKMMCLGVKTVLVCFLTDYYYQLVSMSNHMLMPDGFF